MFPSLPSLQVVKSQPFKRSQLGLFQSKSKQYGNNVPFSLKKTRRTWLPNVQSKRLASDILGQTLKLKVTTRALATIHKYGGLDSYIMQSSLSVLGCEGMRLRTLMADHIREKEKLNSEQAKAVALKSGLRLDQKVSDKVAAVTAIFRKPSLETARRTRVEAARAKGIESGALSAYETLGYLRNFKPRSAGLSCMQYSRPSVSAAPLQPPPPSPSPSSS